MITNVIHESWKPIMSALYEEPLLTLKDKILPEISYQPSKENIFRVFSMPLNRIKIVLLGQDPYPSPGDAIGYAFAKNQLSRKPASLRIIENELKNNNLLNDSGELDMLSWVDQGIFLLNTALTVETGSAGSHLKYWKPFTQKVIKYIGERNPCIWFLWGKKAQSFQTVIPNKVLVNIYPDLTEIPVSVYKNYILESPHPAAELYSGGKAGFYGNNHFTKANSLLLKRRKLPLINW